MQISGYDTLNFGQKVPTGTLLKIGSGIHNFEEAKNFCLIFDDRFPGHVGYYKKAIKYVQNIASKNSNINSLINDINNIENKQQKIKHINMLSSKLGNEIDVII